MTKKIRKTSIFVCLIMSIALMFTAMFGINKKINVLAADVNEEATVEPFANLFGATVRISSPNGIRFRIALTEEKKQEVFAESSNKTLGMFIFPSDKISANKDNYANLTQKIDITFTESDLYQNDGLWCANGVMSNVYMHNFNRSFIGVGYIATTVGEKIAYEYSTFDESDNVRSMSQVAVAAYVDPDPTIAVHKSSLLSLVNQGIYAAYGVTETRTTNENEEVISTYTVGQTGNLSYEELTQQNPITLNSGVKGNAISILVNDTYTLNPAMAVNGTNVDFEVPFSYVSSDSSIVSVDEEGKLTAVKNGKATITISFGDYSVDVEVASCDPITTTEEFLAIGTDGTSMSKSYLLMNNLDFKGAEIKAFSSNHVKNNKGVTFKGVFDGNGYAISNFTPGINATYQGSVDRERSIFGYMDGGAIVRNVAFLNVAQGDKVSVVAYRLVDGTIENVYVDFTYSSKGGNDNASNPTAGISGHVSANGVIKDCIVKFTYKNTLTFSDMVGAAVAGINAGTIENTQVIYTPNKEGENLNICYTNNGTVSNSVVYGSLDAFYAEADLTAYGEIWKFAEGYEPYLKNATDTLKITADEEMYQGTSIEIETTSTYGTTLTLKNAIDGVTLEGNTLSVANTVAKDTEITVVLTSTRFPALQVEHTVTVKENAYEVTATASEVSLDTVVIGETTKDLGITVKLNGQVVTDGYEIVSENTSVVTVANGIITVAGEGTTNVNVVVNGSAIYTVSVTVTNAYNPIRTISDFTAINTNATTRAGKYILMTDIDFNGAEFAAFSSRNQTDATKLFSGVFDGNGYSFKNIKPIQCATSGSASDSSIFGMLGIGAQIRNLSVVGAELNGWGGVIATYVLKTAVIENCYVEVTMTGTNGVKATQDIGAFVGRLQNQATVRNCISKVTVASGVDTTYIGTIVGMNLGAIENCQAIVTSENTMKVFTSEHASVKGTVSNSVVYAGVDAFYNAESGADLTKYNTTKYWTFDSTNKTVALKKGCTV